MGNLVALFDGAVYAAMATYLRKEGKTEESVDIFWFMGAATVYLLPFLFIFGPGQLFKQLSYGALGFSVPVIAWAICLGVISTGFAFLFISVVLQKIDANVYSLIDIIVSPIVAGILGYLVFAEIPAATTVYGGALLLLSGVWLTHQMRTTPTAV